MGKISVSVNRNTTYSPYELYYGKSIFYNLNVDIEIDLNEVKRKTKEKIIKHMKLIQKTRIPVRYKCGHKVFIKNFYNHKMAPKWLGRYAIIEIYKNMNNLII
ncbi:hypothetical protein DMUE_3865 [Dictyocoela muelleri]|nr:hypothetical protein DMUE_3865 [Dictyocoela muelleri]